MKSILSLAGRWLRTLAFAAAVCCFVAGVLAQGGRWFNKLDVFTHPTPLWAAGAAGALIVWLAMDRKTRVIPALSVLALVSAALLMAPELIAASRAERVAPRDETLKLIQFNVFQNNHDPEATAAWILSEEADILILEEATENARPVLRRLSAAYPFETPCASRRPCTTKVLSKQAPLPRDPSVLIQDGSGAVAWAQFQGKKGIYSVLGVHWVWPDPIHQQWINRRTMLENVRYWPRDSLILTGDFNSTPWSFGLRRQDREIGMERRTRALFSFPARTGPLRPPPVLAIDQVYAGSQWRTVSVKRGPRLGSDHFPVVVVLTR